VQLLNVRVSKCTLHNARVRNVLISKRAIGLKVAHGENSGNVEDGMNFDLDKNAQVNQLISSYDPKLRLREKI
jgi:hypothetical protein